MIRQLQLLSHCLQDKAFLETWQCKGRACWSWYRWGLWCILGRVQLQGPWSLKRHWHSAVVILTKKELNSDGEPICYVCHQNIMNICTWLLFLELGHESVPCYFYSNWSILFVQSRLTVFYSLSQCDNLWIPLSLRKVAQVLGNKPRRPAKSARSKGMRWMDNDISQTSQQKVTAIVLHFIKNKFRGYGDAFLNETTANCNGRTSSGTHTRLTLPRWKTWYVFTS